MKIDPIKQASAIQAYNKNQERDMDKLKANKNNPRPSECQLIEQALEKARPWGLEAEVMWSAMRNYQKFHKSAPETYNIEWALQCGIGEWDL